MVRRRERCGLLIVLHDRLPASCLRSCGSVCGCPGGRPATRAGRGARRSSSSVISATAARGPSLPMPLALSPPYGIRSARHSGVQLIWMIPGVDLPHGPDRAADVAGEDARAQAVARTVGLGDGRRPVLGRAHRHGRAEQLVLAERRAGVDAGDDRRADRGAVSLTAGQEPASPGDGLGDGRPDPLRLDGTYQGPHGGAGRKGVTGTDGFDLGDQCVQEIPVDGAGARSPAAPRCRPGRH